MRLERERFLLSLRGFALRFARLRRDLDERGFGARFATAAAPFGDSTGDSAAMGPTTVVGEFATADSLDPEGSAIAATTATNPTSASATLPQRTRYSTGTGGVSPPVELFR